MIRIAIIEQNKTFRESLKIMLEQISGFHVVLVSSDDRCLFTSESTPAQIVLFDGSISPEHWSELTKVALATGMPFKVLFLTMFREELDALHYAEKMLKSAGKKEFECRIRRMMETQESDCPELSLKLNRS